MLELNTLPNHLHSLAKLFPDYSREELDEAYENLRRYVEFGWKIANRLEREGRLAAILTEAGFNPTLNMPVDHT
jgi:neutral trehalase